MLAGLRRRSPAIIGDDSVPFECKHQSSGEGPEDGGRRTLRAVACGQPRPEGVWRHARHLRAWRAVRLQGHRGTRIQARA